MANICTIDGCEGRVVGRGYCRKHYTRWDRHGDPLFNKYANRELHEDDRFWSYVDRRGPDDCWPWAGGTNRRGYGHARHSAGRSAHRVSFFLTYGRMPEQGDHDCHNRDPECPGGFTCPHRSCCNPRHVVDRSNQQNTAEAHRTRRFCKNGHEVIDTGQRWGNYRCEQCYCDGRERQNTNKRERNAGGPGRGRKKVDTCAKGHRVADGAFYENPKTGQRVCRVCKRDRDNAKRAAKSVASG
jgi:hypothetical protein